MKIKKFTAPTMTEALAKVREELGNDAIILNTRSNRRGGVFDFIGRSEVEVTAAVDEKPSVKNENGSNSTGRFSGSIALSDAGKYAVRQSVGYEPSNGKGLRDVNVKDLKDRINIERVMSDIKELRRSVKVLADSSLTGEMAGLPSNLATLLANMKATGFDDKIAKRITRQLLNELSGAELANPSVILDRTVELLLASMGDVCPIIFAGVKPRIVVFVGPTGSGKTTTIAKLATDFSLNMNKKVSVLTFDTKRIDAIGQLKSYCRIIQIPLYIAYSPDELPGIMPRLMNSDITLVDTPGLGPLDKQQMLEMVEFLQRLVPQEVHLTISVTTLLNEMNRIVECFGTLKPNRVLYTKLDETENYGTMLSFAITSGRPMSYITFGQNVPGDFSLIDPESLIRKNLGKEQE